MSLEGKKVSVYHLAEKLNVEPKEEWKNLFINRVCSPENVQNPCVVVISDKKHLKELKEKPTLLVVGKNIPVEGFKNSVIIKVENPKLALAILLREIYPEEHPTGISEKATIGRNVRIGKDTYIGDFVYIGDNTFIGSNVKIYPGCYIGNNVQIGDNTVIYPNAVVFSNTVIGKNVRIYPGAVIGKDGFGFVFHNGEHIKLNHAGITVIEDNAEIGANTCVDRALLDETVVGKGTKIDNLVQVAHNDKLGKGVILVSQVGLSGSVEVGDYSVLAGQVGVADHVKIGEKTTVVAKSGVTKNLESGKVYGAVLPAVEWSKWKRIYALILKLPELFKKIRTLKG
jgi:UDP-3-O-[3-hydroxymyristoyl] glucosamine N-acyltransferase